MNKLFWISAVGTGLLCAQTPDFSGVWKANDKSQGLPPQSSYVAVIEQKDGQLTQTNGVTIPQRGEQRSMYRWDLTGKEANGALGGLPMKSTTKYEGGTLVVSATQPNNRTITAKYSLSGDGKTLTIELATTGGRGNQNQTLVLDKQPESAGDGLRKPEVTAAEAGHFKNLKLLGGAPASSVIDTMQAFSFALGQNCQFCHVQGDFSSDEKPQKETARKMVMMVMTANKETFGGHPAVRCFTCHQGSSHPPGPKF
jgi:hypothetical protein